MLEIIILKVIGKLIQVSFRHRMYDSESKISESYYIKQLLRYSSKNQNVSKK